NTSERSAQAFPMAAATSSRPTRTCHALEIQAALPLLMCSDDPAIFGSSAKRIFPVPLPQIDSIAYRPLNFLRMSDPHPTTDPKNQRGPRTELSAKSPAAPNTPGRNSAHMRSPSFAVLAENSVLHARSSQAGFHSVHLQLTVFP